MSRRTAESNKAIHAAWNKEQELVQEEKGQENGLPNNRKIFLIKVKPMMRTV